MHNFTDSQSSISAINEQQPNESTSSNIISSGEEVLYDLLFADDTNGPNLSTNNSSHLDSNKTGFNLMNSYLANNSANSNETKRKTLEESYSYLLELNSYHVDRLQVEPSILQEKKQHIQEEIKNLAFSNYKTFIRTAQCSREIYSDFSIIDSKLDNLIGKLPEFGSMCETFTKNIQVINTSRRSNNLTLHKHNQLLEILEISQLMDTCVRNEYYEEALDLAAYVKRLEKKFSTSIPLIQNIVDDLNASLNLMLKQLLQQLKTNLQFNQCLKIIGIIRRLDVFTESELRVKFLQLRDSWLQSLLQNIPTNDPYHHISKTIEENRIHLFDIITQYKAIFSSDDILISNNSSSGTGSSSSQYFFGSSFLLLNSKETNESKLFYCWLQQKIKNFLNVLRKDLKLGVGNRLDSVLSQSMYFGLAFSRVGLDFRALMVPIFEEAVLEQVKKSLTQANSKFEESLLKLNWSELYLDSVKSLGSSQTYDILFSTNTNQDKKSNTTALNPPLSLLEFQPLAIYLNCLLQCFNELRLCAPLSLFLKITNMIQDSLKKVSLFIESYYKKEKIAFDTNEQELIKSFMFQLAYELIPFVEKCLNALFPINQLQKIIGTSQTDLDKLKKCLKLNSDLILDNIKELIPSKINITNETNNADASNDTKQNLTENVVESYNENLSDSGDKNEELALEKAETTFVEKEEEKSSDQIEEKNKEKPDGVDDQKTLIENNTDNTTNQSNEQIVNESIEANQEKQEKEEKIDNE